MEAKSKVARVVQIWLIVGLVMIFFQVVIGGVTRLSDSGLSITEWSVIQGTLPPMNKSEWIEAFDLYKVHAKKQYESLHGDMTLGEFKVIFFWEYFHRLWARLMGFVFIIPFIIFNMRGMMPRWLNIRLGIVILLAAAVAIFGWIMVKSGLNADNRTWVSAYKLITHLGLAAALFCYLFWTWLKSSQICLDNGHSKLYRLGWGVAVLLMLQILLGGLMAGMRAGLIHAYWPFFVNGNSLITALYTSGIENEIFDYEASVKVKAVVQVLHRAMAYILSGVVIWFALKIKKLENVKLMFSSSVLILLLITQFILGILTIINAIGSIPISYGALHQCVALLLFATLLYVIYHLKPRFSTEQ